MGTKNAIFSSQKLASVRNSDKLYWVERQEESMFPRVGEKFHGFRIIGKCGHGSYGEVYLAEDLLERKVALKIIEKQVSTGTYEREWKGLKAYACKIAPSHPKLISVYYADEDEDFLFYTMELADNVSDKPNGYKASTLEYLIRKEGRLNAEKIFDIADHLLNAIEALHSFGLTHRDIKPANIVYVRGALKLGDIGLVSDNLECSFVGTQPFLPPEKLNDPTGKQLTSADDFYALGKTLYVLFTGQGAEKFPEFSNESTFSESSKRLNQFITKLAAQDPAQRISDLSTIRSLLVSARQEINKRSSQKHNHPDPLINYLCLDQKWDSGTFDNFLRHLNSFQKESLKITLGLTNNQKFSSISAEEMEIKKQLLWHYSTMIFYPFKSNEVPYHDVVRWIAEKKGVQKSELLAFNTFQLECRIFEKLLAPRDNPVTTSSLEIIRKAGVLQEIDLQIVTQAIVLLYNIKREVIEQHYDELPVKPKYPCELKESPKTV